MKGLKWWRITNGVECNVKGTGGARNVTTRLTGLGGGMGAAVAGVYA